MNNEPVAWMTENRYLITKDENLANIIKEKGEEPIIPLYTHPAKTLTDEEIGQIYRDVKADSLFEQTFPYRFAHAIQVALGVKEPLQPNSGLGGIALRKAQEK
jgi:hypothetical protein